MTAVFAHTIPFVPEGAAALLAEVPAASAVFSLGFGADREPYISHSTDLRRRLRRILAPEGALSRRLHLLPFVRSISWTPVGSAFASDLLLYRASAAAYGLPNARKRLRLRPPVSLRLLTGNDFPRLVLSHKFIRSAAGSSFGPFASRTAAERTLEAVLDLFQLRRCIEDLAPFPEHPACAYAEMKKCLAPCNQSCTPERYAEEAAAIFEFLRTHGRSLLGQLEKDRAAASEALEFESAAAIHVRYEKVAVAVTELPEAMQLLSGFATVIVQPSATPGEVALFALRNARLTGPIAYSTPGMRLHNEQSGSSSLFSHPVALEPVPLATPDLPASRQTTPAPSTLEARLAAALAALDEEAAGTSSSKQPSPVQTWEDHLALFTRWFYRPQTRRQGEAVFPDPATGEILYKPLLRAISRVARAAAAAELPLAQPTA